jgi:lysozyme
MSDKPDNPLKRKLAAKIGATAVACCVPLVMYFEGTIPRAYRDPIGIVTSCTGHTGPELKMGQTFSKEQCDTQLYADLLAHADALDCVKVPLAEHQKAAFLSFAFNVGKPAFCGSTLVRLANAHDIAAACAQLSRWVMAGGQELPGLVKRRAAERALCEGRFDAIPVS